MIIIFIALVMETKENEENNQKMKIKTIVENINYDDIGKMYYITLPIEKLKDLKIIKYPSSNSLEKSRLLCDQIQKKRAYCLFLKDMSTPDTYSEMMVDVFRLQTNEKMMHFIWAKKDNYFRIDSEDYYQFEGEEETEGDEQKEELIRIEKQKVKEERINILKKAFPQIENILDFDFLSIYQLILTEDKVPIEFSSFFNEIWKNINDNNFRKRYNEKIYLKQALQFLINNINDLEEKTKIYLLKALKENIENSEIVQMIKNDHEIWDLLKININKNSDKQIDDFKMPNIFKNIDISKEEILNTIIICQCEKLDLFDIIIMLYIQKKEKNSERQRQKNELEEFCMWKKDIEKVFT